MLVVLLSRFHMLVLLGLVGRRSHVDGCGILVSLVVALNYLVHTRLSSISLRKLHELLLR